MREIRLSGSEGGVGQSNAPSLPLSEEPYGPNPRRCAGFSHGALLGLGRLGSSYGLFSLDSRPRHTDGAFSKFSRGVSDESFLKFAYYIDSE